MEVASYIFGLLIVITLIVVYFPIIFIRKSNKILETLERIEANTRKQP
jgi:hypothetical protein